MKMKPKPEDLYYDKTPKREMESGKEFAEKIEVVRNMIESLKEKILKKIKKEREST